MFTGSLILRIPIFWYFQDISILFLFGMGDVIFMHVIEMVVETQLSFGKRVKLSTV